MIQKSLDPTDYEAPRYEDEPEYPCENDYCHNEAEDGLGTDKCLECSWDWASEHEADANPAVQAIARRIMKEIERLEDEQLARCGK